MLDTELSFPQQTNFYRGKVRDVYTIADKLVLMVASNRISAFDCVLPRAIPYKGQVLNQLAAYFLEATKEVVPNWLLSTPAPNVSLGRACQPFKVEMVVRAYLTGHAWRTYAAGGRMLCGVALPDGLRQHDPLPSPMITPTTKADKGHDEDISRAAIIERGIVLEKDYEILEQYALALFAEGQRMATERGLLLVDTKYEFGKANDTGEILLIDEVHTPDSSRYFYAEGYAERQAKGEPQQQLSKEFVREWLIANGFQGKEGQVVPIMSDEFVTEISARYIHLYETITGKTFNKVEEGNTVELINSVLHKYI